MSGYCGLVASLLALMSHVDLQPPVISHNVVIGLGKVVFYVGS